MWQQGETVVWRGIYRNRIWHAQAMIVVRDSPHETVLALLPGTECVAPADYVAGKKEGKYRWNFEDKPWELHGYSWQTNRLLFLLEPDKYYSTIFFWHQENGEFRFYYMNFQLPFQRSERAIDTLDLDLDLIIHPNFHYEWKDADEYQESIDHNVILPEWTLEIDTAKADILQRLEGRHYPFDGSWVNWQPDRAWAPPTLPENWDKIEISTICHC